VPRRCPACQTVIDDDRLIACPNPQCPSHFSGAAQALPLSQDRVDRLVTPVADSLSKSGATLDKLAKPVAWRIFKNFHWWIAMPLFYLGFLVLSVYSIKNHLENLTITRISHQFAEPHIRETFQEVAENQASKMLKDEIQPAVERFRADLLKEYQTVSDELSRIKLLAYLPVLSDQAISEGDREAFEEIIRIAEEETENSPLKKVAIEQMNRIKGSFSKPSSFIGPSLIVTLEDGTIRKGGDIPTDRLMINLSDSDWKIRAEAAILLGLRTEKGVPDILLQVARTDKNLWVIYHAFVSFGYVTRQVKRPRLAGGTPITLPQGIHMFDIDKLEQWWQEHSADVNEQLADMK
jgi:hypothetical protein